MTVRFRSFPRLALCGLVTVLVDPASAQVPAGSAVVGTYSGPRSSGSSGLFVVPLAGGALRGISGLPAELRLTGGGTFQQGVGSVGLRTTDGAIVVGTISSAASPTGGAIELYVLHLNGLAVDPARTQKILLGTTSSVGGARVAVLPDDRILVAAADGGSALAAGPMAGSLFAVVDASGPVPAFSLLPTPTGTGADGGLAVDATGKIVYYTLTTNINLPTRVGSLYRWDLVTNQSCSIASWPGQVAKGVACDDDGTVYVSANDGTAITHLVHAVRPDGCNPAAVSSAQSSLPMPALDLALDRASGLFAVATAGWAPGFSSHFNSLALVDPTGVAKVIAAPPPGGWGLMAGAAVSSAIASYGTPSHGQNHYWFDNFSNPGGQPTVGNQGFSLTSSSEPGTAVWSGFLLSAGRGSTPLLGANILVDLGASIGWTIPSALSTTIPIPIPNVASLSGAVLNAQTLHVEAGPVLALNASRGLNFTIQP